ncbi:MAG: xylulokinase [Planctomycetota bacterium]|nr:xylulokinase [Planctomycetota bacterium]
MFLGIDIGTSGAKAIVIDREGRIVGRGASTYPRSQPHPGWSEQDPRDWWEGASIAARQALAGVDSTGVRALALSGQMHGLTVIDADESFRAGTRVLNPVRPAILWNDQRCEAQCAEIEAAFGGRLACVRTLGNAPLAGFTLPKLLWLRKHEPDALANPGAFLLPKDYVRFTMTGELATDYGDASGTLMLDMQERRWSDQACALAGIDRRRLPALRESAVNAGILTPWAAGEFGVPRATAAIAGSGDNQAGAVGAGVVKPGDALLSLGTSGVLYVHSDRARFDDRTPGKPGRVHTFFAGDGKGGSPASWCNTGCMLSACASLDWAKRELAPQVPLEALLEEAATAPAGSDGLVFLPHLTGERCPHPSASARGAWVGLTERHTRAHLVRAVLEGVALTMRQILDIMREARATVSRVRVIGGGAKSALWRQIHADAMGVPLVSLESEEGPALGAAILAGVGMGAWPGVREACEVIVREKETTEPTASGTATYEEVLARYKTVYPGLESYCRATAGE